MTGHLVRDALRRLPEFRGQTPVFLEPHQVFTDVERAFGQQGHVARRRQVRIFPFEHETATGRGDDQVVPLLEIRQKQSQMVRGGLRHGLGIPEIKGRHAATALSLGHDDFHVVLGEDLHRGFADIRGLIVHHTTREQHHFVFRNFGLQRRAAFAPPRGKVFPGKGQYLPVAVQAEDRFQQAPNPLCRENPVGQRGGQAAEFPDQVRFDQQAVAPGRALFPDPLLFPRGHETREIDPVVMGRRVRAVVVTELAVITFLLDPFVIRGGQPGNVALILVDPVQQCVEGRTEVETAPAAVAHVEDAIRLPNEIVARPVGGNEMKVFQRRS